jgi:TatD DNase family protein
MLKNYKGKGLRGVFHCFSESLELAQEILKLDGFLLGIGGVLTYKNAGLPEVLKQIDLQHIILETDSPYLPPVPHRGKRNEPAYTRLVAEKLADVKGVSLRDIADITTANAEQLFGL